MQIRCSDILQIPYRFIAETPFVPKKAGLRGAWVVVDEVAKEARRAEALVIIRKHVRRAVSMWWYGKYGEYIK